MLTLATIAASTASAQSFNYMLNVQIFGLSDDGTIAVGTRSTTSQGFEWMNSTGLVLIDGVYCPFTHAISGDGQVIAGADFRYTASGGIQHLGSVGNYTAPQVLSANRDGSVLVGSATTEDGKFGDAFVWTMKSGIKDLGHLYSGDYYAQASAVSRDGSTVVGFSSNDSADQAFVWTAGGGMQKLAELTPGYGGRAYGVNSDGSVVLGMSGVLQYACIWRNGVPQALGRVQAQFEQDVARVMSANGLLIGGYSYAGNGLGNLAAVWTPAGGELLVDYLKQFGITIPSNLTLRDITGISADGTTIAGLCFDPSMPGGANGGFVVTIPTPSALGVACLGLVAFRRRR